MKFFTKKNKDIENLFETVNIMSAQIDIIKDDIVEIKKDIKTPLAVLNKKIKDNNLDLYKILEKIKFLEDSLKIINDDIPSKKEMTSSVKIIKRNVGMIEINYQRYSSEIQT